MNDWVGLIIVIVVILIIWWLLTRFAKQGPEEFELHHKVEEPPAVPVETPTRVTSIPLEKAPGIPDDLLIVEGIGPKVNKLLHSKGITTFAGLAETSPEVIKQWLSENGMAYMDPTSWPQQAKLAAEGRMEEFQRLTDSLKGGRKK